MMRTQTSATYMLEASDGPPIAIDIMPELLPGSILESVVVDGVPVHTNGVIYRGVLSLPIRVLLDRRREILFKYSGGVGICPIVPQPEPGGGSSAPRVISSRNPGKTCHIVLEGAPGSATELTLAIGSHPIKKVTHATMLDDGRKAEVRLQVVFPNDTRAIVRQEVEVETE